MTDKLTSIWMLFASGASVEVHANSYEAPAGSKRPVDAYVVSDCDGDCEEAAARAVETVWQAVSVQGRRLKPLVFGFDLPGKKSRKPVVGASGGLAFVVSAMQKFTGCSFGHVAATGILQSTDLDAPLMPVRSIIQKIEAALQLIPSGGVVLYPQSNDAEIPKDLRTRFIDKNIRLLAVDDVSHALEILMEHVTGEKPGQPGMTIPKWLLFAVCGLLTSLLVVAATLYFQVRVPEKPLPVVDLPPPQEQTSIETVPVIQTDQEPSEATGQYEDPGPQVVENPSIQEGVDGQNQLGNDLSRESEEEEPYQQNYNSDAPPQPSRGFD